LTHPTSNEGQSKEAGNKILSLDELIENRGKLQNFDSLTKATQKISSSLVPIDQQRENTRALLATRLFSILIISLVGTGFYIFVDLLMPKQISQERSNMHREIITLIWTSQVTLMGSALGFYFGSERNGSSNSKKTDADV